MENDQPTLSEIADSVIDEIQAIIKVRVAGLKLLQVAQLTDQDTEQYLERITYNTLGTTMAELLADMPSEQRRPYEAVEITAEEQDDHSMVPMINADMAKDVVDNIPVLMFTPIGDIFCIDEVRRALQNIFGPKSGTYLGEILGIGEFTGYNRKLVEYIAERVGADLLRPPLEAPTEYAAVKDHSFWQILYFVCGLLYQQKFECNVPIELVPESELPYKVDRTWNYDLDDVSEEDTDFTLMLKLNHAEKMISNTRDIDLCDDIETYPLGEVARSFNIYFGAKSGKELSKAVGIQATEYTKQLVEYLVAHCCCHIDHTPEPYINKPTYWQVVYRLCQLLEEFAIGAIRPVVLVPTADLPVQPSAEKDLKAAKNTILGSSPKSEPTFEERTARDFPNPRSFPDAEEQDVEVAQQA